MYIDSHSHPQFPQYDQDREEMITRTLQRGVKMICVGTDLEMSKKAVELAEGQEGIWASVGLHPNDNLDEVLDIEEYRKLLVHPKVVAVGEVGLDYFRTTGEENIFKQKDRFIKFLELSRESGKPLILHCREAYQDMLEMISSAGTLFGGSAVRGVLHSFTSTWEVAQKFIDLGFYIGLNGIITFPPSRKATEGQAPSSLDEVIKNIPLDKLLLETDAPYLSPIPHRGKRNESSYIEFVAQKIAQMKGESVEKVAEETTKNTKKLFGI
ncbi:MAG: TatD family hydrolase [bacterium]|nr:TatD family hydrolase [bacterium]